MNDQAQQMMIGGGGGGGGGVQPPMMNPLPPGPPPPPGLMSTVQSQMMNANNQAQMLSGHSQAMNQQPMMMAAMNNQRVYKPWMQQNQLNQNQNQNQHPPGKFGYFVPSKPRTNNNNNNNNWKGKNKDRRMGNNNNKLNTGGLGGPGGGVGVGGGLITGSSTGIVGGGIGGYMPPSLNELQNQNRMKTQKHYHHSKKKYNNRYAPYAPRNSTSFIIRAKKSGGIASLVSPCPVTPAVLPTPDIHIQPMEVLGDVAKEEWGVDGYGSMKGLIRLRSPGHEMEGGNDEDEDDESSGSSESDVEEHVEVERRLDHDLSRFEMIYPSNAGGGEYSFNNVLENRVDDQDTHIAHLEEENLTLKERLFLVETELDNLRRRLLLLERQQNGRGGMEEVNEGIVENVSENDMNENESNGESDGAGDSKIDVNKEHSNEDSENVNHVKLESKDISMPEFTHSDEDVEKKELKFDALVASKEEPRINVMPEEVTDKSVANEDIVEDKMDGGTGQVQV